MRPAAVLDAGPEAKALADAFSLPLVAARAPGRASIAVVSDDDDASFLASAPDRGGVAVVVAFGTTEAAVHRLLSAGFPVLCGMPSEDALAEALDGWGAERSAAAAAEAGVLAALEQTMLGAARA